MCLHKVNRNPIIGDPPIMAEDTGYKVFVIDAEKPGHLKGPYYSINDIPSYEYDVEYEASKEPCYINGTTIVEYISYQAGFHYFVHLGDAVTFAKFLSSTTISKRYSCVVRKVQVKDVVAEGWEYDSGGVYYPPKGWEDKKSCVRVARKMLIESGEAKR